jgi:hypothetical protein
VKAEPATSESSLRNTSAATACAGSKQSASEFFPAIKQSAYSGTFRGVGMNGSSGVRRVFVVRLDRLDNEIEVNAPRRVISHDEHNTRAAFRPRKQEEMIGAEVDIEGRRQGAGAGMAPASMGSAVRVTRRTPPLRDIATAASRILIGLANPPRLRGTRASQ